MPPLPTSTHGLRDPRSISRATRRTFPASVDPRLLASWPKWGGVSNCFDFPATADGRTTSVAMAGSSPVQSGARYRTTAVLPIFLIENSPKLSTWAQQDLLWFLREAPSTAEMVAIHGSADPQGPPTSNNRTGTRQSKGNQRLRQGQFAPSCRQANDLRPRRWRPEIRTL